MYIFPFTDSFLSKNKLIIRTSFSSISIWPLLSTLPYTLYNTIECRVEYLIRKARELRFGKEEITMINLYMEIMKGKKLGIINKIMKKNFRGVLNSVLKRTVQHPTNKILFAAPSACSPQLAAEIKGKNGGQLKILSYVGM